MCQLKKKYESNPTNIETESQERIAIREFVKNQSMHTYGMPIAEYIENAIVDGFFLFNLRKDKYMVNSKQELLNYNADENVSLEEKLYFWDIFLYNQRPKFLSFNEHEYIRATGGTLDGFFEDDEDDDEDDDDDEPYNAPPESPLVVLLRPILISDELAEFLGKTVGTEMKRTDVSKMINAYLKANGLQDSQNSRIINPDEKLRKLLGLTNEVELTYFSLQKYLKPHFIK
jgi:chromatin remodeling complex protein RSC6